MPRSIYVLAVYRIANQFPDGGVLWIFGEFEVVDPPHRLVYTWRVDPQSQAYERVAVTFEPRGDSTEVSILHERIRDLATRGRHQLGWERVSRWVGELLESQQRQCSWTFVFLSVRHRA